MFFKKIMNKTNDCGLTIEQCEKKTDDFSDCSKNENNNGSENKSLSSDYYTSIEDIIPNLSKLKKGNTYKNRIDTISNQIINDSKYIIKDLEFLCSKSKEKLMAEDLNHFEVLINNKWDIACERNESFFENEYMSGLISKICNRYNKTWNVEQSQKLQRIISFLVSIDVIKDVFKKLSNLYTDDYEMLSGCKGYWNRVTDKPAEKGKEYYYDICFAHFYVKTKFDMNYFETKTYFKYKIKRILADFDLNSHQLYMKNLIETDPFLWKRYLRDSSTIKNILMKPEIDLLTSSFVNKLIFRNSDNYYRKLVSISCHIVSILEDDKQMDESWYLECEYPMSSSYEINDDNDPIKKFGFDDDIINSYDLLLKIIQKEVEKYIEIKDTHHRNILNFMLYKNIQLRCINHCNELYNSMEHINDLFFDESDEITFTHYYIDNFKNHSLVYAHFSYCLQCERNFKRRNYIKNTESLLEILQDNCFDKRNYDIYTISDIDKMNGIEFEQFLGILYKTLDYTVQITKPSQDQGADLIVQKNGIKEVIQVKHYESSKVGNKAVQEVIAAKVYYQCDKASVITNNYFTKQACQLADSSSVNLVNRDKLITLLEVAKISKNKENEQF